MSAENPCGHIIVPSLKSALGIAFRPDDGLDVESLVSKADEMMYFAK